MSGGHQGGLEEEFRADLRRLGEVHQAYLAKTWSLRAAARALQLSPTTVSEWLRGTRLPQQPDTFARLIGLLRTALTEAGINLPSRDLHLLDPDAWRARHTAVARQRAEAAGEGVRRAQAATALAEAEVRARYAALPDKPRPIGLWTPQQLGVHPAIHGASEVTDGAFVLPDFVERDHDRQLRAHLETAASGERAVLLVVRGESCTGKTRTAYEAVRACLGDWKLVFPKDADSLLALLAAHALTPRTVLWLNEAQDFLLGPTGEAVAAGLRRRLEEPGPVVLLATLWPKYHDDLTATVRPGEDPRPNARALLGPVAPVHVPGSFTGEALRDVYAHPNGSLATAARTSRGGAITQTLAAGPQLVDHYRHVVPPHGPYGKAVITAAMDARRLGGVLLLPVAFLEAAAPGYLTDEQRAVADPGTWFADALAYARTRIKGVVAALETVAHPTGMGALPDVYRLADYLDHDARTSRQFAAPPASFWAAVQAHVADPVACQALAGAAQARGRYGIAAVLYRQAAQSGRPGALLRLVWLLKAIGDREGVERLYRHAVDAYRSVADAGDLQIAALLAKLAEETGDREGARLWYLRAADAGDPFVLRALGWISEGMGDFDGMRHWFGRAVDAGDANALDGLATAAAMAGEWEEAARLGRQSEHPFVLGRLADRAARTGDWAGVEHCVRAAIDAGEPFALSRLTKLQQEFGDPDSEERLRRLAATADETQLFFGPEWLREERNPVLVLERAGDREGAEQLALASGEISTLVVLAGVRKKDGDLDAAERLYRRASEDGSADALIELALMREAAGDPGGADALARRVVDTGKPGVVLALARVRAVAGNWEGAEWLYRTAADAGDVFAMVELARRREESGDWEGAERLYRTAAGTDGVRKIVWLAESLLKDGNRDGAELLLRAAADAGDSDALAGLAQVREAVGDQEGAEQLTWRAHQAGDPRALGDLAEARAAQSDLEGLHRLYPLAVAADGFFDLERLARLLEEAGDRDGAERLYWQALDSGHSGALRYLARLRKADGDDKAAEGLPRFGVTADGSPAEAWTV